MSAQRSQQSFSDLSGIFWSTNATFWVNSLGHSVISVGPSWSLRDLSWYLRDISWSLRERTVRWALNELSMVSARSMGSQRMLSGHLVVFFDLHEICRNLNFWSLNGPSWISSVSTETTFWGVYSWRLLRDLAKFLSLNGFSVVSILWKGGFKLIGRPFQLLEAENILKHLSPTDNSVVSETSRSETEARPASLRPRLSLRRLRSSLPRTRSLETETWLLIWAIYTHTSHTVAKNHKQYLSQIHKYCCYCTAPPQAHYHNVLPLMNPSSPCPGNGR